MKKGCTIGEEITLDYIAVKEKNRNNYLIKIISYLYEFTKRGFDILASIFGLIVLSPVLLLTAILIKLDSKGPILLDQRRIGKGGKEFKFYKFRSMVDKADDVLMELLKDKKIAKEYSINKKLENDPRITRVGKFIRKYSIDELPQLLNILKGDMSFIGNRPYLPREKDDMGEYFNDIVKTKPGLTGYWQVNGRSDTTFKTRLKLEEYYSNNRNLKLDIKIFFKTFIVVFKNKGSR